MFSDGVTILNAEDPRQLKPVGFFTAGVNTRTHHLQVVRRSDVARQRRQHRRHAVLRQHARVFREHAGRQHHQPQDVPRGPEHPRHLPPGRDEGNRLPADAWARHQPSVVAGRPLRLRVRAFRRLHRSHPLHRRPEEHHQAGDRVALVAARHESRGRRNIRRPEGPPLRSASHDHRRRSRLRRMAGRRLHGPRYQRPDRAQVALAHQLVTAVYRRHSHAAAIARTQAGGRA